MAFLAKGSSGEGGHFEYEPTPAGTYQAVIFNVFDLGNQAEEYKGQRKVRHKASIGFEIPSLTYKTGEYTGKPMTKYKDYSITLFENKGLAGLIPMLIGRALTEDEIKNGFDLEQLIGLNCLLTITHKLSASTGRTYANIANIGGLVTGMQAVAPSIARDYTPKHIAELQAQAIPGAKPVEAFQESDPDYQQSQAKIEWHWKISDLEKAGKLKHNDISATIRVVGGARHWGQLTDAEAQTVYLRLMKLAGEIK